MLETDLPFDRAEATRILAEACDGADDGDIYVQRARSESFMYDDGRLKSAAFDTAQGFGLRVVAGEASGNAHAGELTLDAIRRAATTAAAAKRGYSGSLAAGPAGSLGGLYTALAMERSATSGRWEKVWQWVDRACASTTGAVTCW